MQEQRPLLDESTPQLLHRFGSKTRPNLNLLQAIYLNTQISRALSHGPPKGKVLFFCQEEAIAMRKQKEDEIKRRTTGGGGSIAPGRRRNPS